MKINPNNSPRPTPPPPSGSKTTPEKAPAEETPPAIETRVPDLKPNDKNTDRQQQLLEATEHLKPEKKDTEQGCRLKLQSMYSDIGDNNNLVIKP